MKSEFAFKAAGPAFRWISMCNMRLFVLCPEKYAQKLPSSVTDKIDLDQMNMTLGIMCFLETWSRGLFSP